MIGPGDRHAGSDRGDVEGDSPWPFVRALAAHGLVAGPALPPAPSDLFAWQRIVRLAEQQRVLGLVAAAVAVGDLVVDDEQRRILADTHEAWCAHDLRLERALLHSADALDAASIPYLVMKGPALAHRCYPDPAQRVFADIDLVVPGRHLHQAAAVLSTELDAAASHPELRPGFDERFGKETLLRTAPTRQRPGGLEIDVHRMPVAGALGLAIPLDELFDGPGEVLIAGRALPTPGPVPTLLLACYQASVTDIPPRLAAARDVLQLLASDAADPDELVATARRWQATAVVAQALRHSRRTLALPADAGPAAASQLFAWADSVVPSARERLLLSAHQRPGYVYWRQLAGLVVVRGTRARVDYLRALALPQQDYLADRRWSIGHHARRAWRAVTSSVRNRLVRTVRRVRRRAGLV